jgi:WD40 repeat protein
MNVRVFGRWEGDTVHHAKGSVGFGFLARLITAVTLLLGTARSASPPAAAAPGSQLWVERYDGPGSYVDSATDVTVGPNGETVFVTGYDFGDSTGWGYATVAYAASTGTMLWLKRYNGPGDGQDEAAAIAVSPDGSKVFVTGFSDSSTTSADWATIAYDASTGAKLWVRRFNGPADDVDEARAIGVSPDGSAVFVTGGSFTSAQTSDYQTLAYRASDGSRLWGRRYNGPGDSGDGASAIAISPTGSAVFVTGTSDGASTFADYATVAYAPSNGATLWTKRHNDSIDGDDFARAVGVSPDGAMVFVTGSTSAATRYDNYTTIAYAAATGAKIWQKSYNGPPDHIDLAHAIAVSSEAVYVTGFSHGGSSTHLDYATVAYKASDGSGLWTKRFDGPGSGDDKATAIAVNPSGSAVFVTGVSYSSTTLDDYATVSYDAATGTTLWVKRYQRPSNDVAADVVVSPDGSRVFVTGVSARPATVSDYATVAYATA